MRNQLPVLITLVLSVFATIGLSTVSEARSIQQTQAFAGESESSSAVADWKRTTAPGKFTASGEVSETLDSGPCAGSLAETEFACSPGAPGGSQCDQLQFGGPVTVTGRGNFTLLACMTFAKTAVGAGGTTLNVCFNGLGTGP
jgi:hypothetical protein